MKEVAEMAPKVLSSQEMKSLFEQSATVASSKPLKVLKVEYFTPQGKLIDAASEVDRTRPGSKNDYRVTYDTGSQKWTNDRPGDGVGDSTGELLMEHLKDPAVQRGLDAIANAIEAEKGVQEAVNGMVRDVGTEDSTTILNAVYRGMKQSKAPDKKVNGWNGARKMVSSVRDVVDRIFDTFDVDRATEIAERLVKFWKTKDDRYDLTQDEQHRIYRKVDYGEVLPLSKKRKLDVEWTDHGEYRGDLRDREPEKVNRVIQDRLRNKLNPPQRGKVKFKEPGVGSMVVDFDTRKNPADAKVVTVWGSENFYNGSKKKKAADMDRERIAGELVMIAKDLVAVQTRLRFTGSKIPKDLRKALGSLGLIGFDFSDKGYSLSFDREVDERNIARRLSAVGPEKVYSQQIDFDEVNEQDPDEFIYFVRVYDDYDD
jgi:hypothetical protein